MSRKKRTATSLQTLAVFFISAGFVLIALMGLYKCFSKEPEVADTGMPVQSARDLQEEGARAPAGRKDRFYTVLVGGLDDENGGSDTNLLVALDAANGTINVCSLPRDTLLNVSWTVQKLNNAYHHGGFRSTVEEVSNLLGIPVDFYITVNLEGFVELVDAIEGVDFDIPDRKSVV